MTISLAHLKMTIRDVFQASTADENHSYICTLYNSTDETPLLFKNCRLQGLIVDHTEDSSFILDDGTGLIQIVDSEHRQLERPPIGVYVEVLGQIQGNIGRTISLLCFSVRNNPMEEVRQLLEQAAIHRDILKFRQSMHDRFLSSDPSMPNGFDRLTNVVADLLTNCDPEKGVPFAQIQAVCEDDMDITNRVIYSLQKSGVGWSQDEVLFPL
jgi:hypothetical protein